MVRGSGIQWGFVLFINVHDENMTSYVAFGSGGKGIKFQSSS